MKKIRIKQHHISDCGAACLASVAAWFGLRLPLEQIRQWSGTQTHGISVQGIREGAEHMHLSTQALKRDSNTGPADENLFSNLPVPSILHILKPNGFSHFVVFYGLRKGKVKKCRIMDPEDGRIHRISVANTAKTWTGVVVTLSPGEGFQKGNLIPSFSHRLGVLMKGQRRQLAVALGASFLYTFTGIASALFLQQIADLVIPGNATRFLQLMGLAMVYIACCSLALNVFRIKVLLQTGFRTATRLVGGFYRHILYLPQKFFDQRQSGELVARINDTFKVSTFLSSGILNIALSIFTLFFSLLVMFLFNKQLSLLCLVSVPLYAGIYYLFDLRNKDTQRDIMVAQAQLETSLVDSLRGVAQIKYSTAQEYMIATIQEKYSQYVKNAWKGGMNQLRAATLGDAVNRGMGLAILWLGATFVTHGQLSFGQLLTFYALTAYFSAPVSEIISFSQKYRDARIATDRLFEIMELEPEQKPGALPVMAGGLVNAVVAEEPAGENLVLDGISFHYPGRLTLFDNFSCVFRAGQITGIAGESGSGKSTLGSLLLRMYLPDAGSVRLGSRDACDIPLDTWRRIVGIVPQKADLFEGTILENIVLGDRTPDMDHVVTLCEELGLRPFLAALPRGILTPIGEQGVQLSGGQRQRLALARTAYRRPSWIVLDEATSSLDSTSEEAVLSALRKWSLLGTGIVIIGHRMSTLSIASRIILLDQGRIAEEGSHDELVRNNGNYAAWCRQQGL
ncbi:MAG: peptidase domain-containing ABC transporter [Bacteroidales bacterium]|jgi:ABC-type bacteriocin/lantibiotic exporter with double-glycine peptidase domain|nr:peptidase domain-containing ABC transporter [Bacteroidales bacterium]NLK79267.1 peptidase domain-containing ABC transporter [Bacteroidales bacterium]HKM30818.1 peptidase domain-containing ABC transporter [Bacteroidales bacterium]